MNTHKEILEHILSQPDAQSDLQRISWSRKKSAKVGDLTVTHIAENIADYYEGTVYTDHIYEVNGLLFMWTRGSNSWDDYCDDTFELLPAEAFQTTAYRVIK